MKCAVPLLVLPLLIGTGAAAQTPQTLRAELANSQQTAGYLLADVYWATGRKVEVEDRSETHIDVKDAQQLELAECTSADRKYSVLVKYGIQLRNNKSGELQSVDSDGWAAQQCFSPEGKFVYSSKHIITS